MIFVVVSGKWIGVKNRNVNGVDMIPQRQDA